MSNPTSTASPAEIRRASLLGILATQGPLALGAFRRFEALLGPARPFQLGAGACPRRVALNAAFARHLALNLTPAAAARLIRHTRKAA